jgi:hypothetical protein
MGMASPNNRRTFDLAYRIQKEPSINSKSQHSNENLRLVNEPGKKGFRL